MKRIMRRGYTLLELVMVLAIIGLSGMVVVPRVNAIVNAWQLDTGINKMKSKIHWAQQSAIAEQVPYRLVWTPTYSYCAITKFNSMSGSYVNVEAPTYGNNIKVISTTLTIIPNTFEFDKFGAPSDAGMINFQNSITGQTKSIKILAVTGHEETF